MGHPDIAVLEEIPIMGLVADAVGPLDRIADIDQDEADQLRDVYFAELERHVPSGFDGLVLDKMPLNMTCMPLIHRLFPDSRIVFAQRHPCDCVLSGFMQNFQMNPGMACFLDLASAADLYDVSMEIWTRSRQVLPLNVNDIVYERLIEAPEQMLRGLIDFLGLDWRAEIVEHRRSASVRGVIATASYDQVTEPLNRASMGRWRHYETQLKPVMPVLLPWADRLGYTD
jgi:hypothetical protein